MKAMYTEHMGSDHSIANTARVSMEELGSLGWHDLPNGYSEEKCEKLLNYLAKHNHWTPFAHPHITLGMTAPVPIRTQCFKHKVGFVENEESRRYISATPTIYHPNEWRSSPEGSIKQGSAGVHPLNARIKEMYADYAKATLGFYNNLLELGVAPEQARFALPQGTEVSWIWTGSLSAFARFYKQRTDPHAQKEIQELAEEVGKLIEPHFPVAWKLLTK